MPSPKGPDNLNKEFLIGQVLARSILIKDKPHAHDRGETIAAEDIMHDIGAISAMSSDSQAMGRVGEVITRTWQTADKVGRADSVAGTRSCSGRGREASFVALCRNRD